MHTHVPHTVTLHIPTTMAARRLGARIPTISGPSSGTDSENGRNTTCRGKVNVVNVLPSSEL